MSTLIEAKEVRRRPRALSPLVGARQAQFTLDIIVLACSFLLAYLLRFDFSLPLDAERALLVQLPYIVSIQFAVLLLTGVYRFIWRYVGLTELKRFLLAALYSALPVILMRAALPDSLSDARVPLSIIFLDTMLGFGGVLGLRVLRRTVHEGGERKSTKNKCATPGAPVLMVGAGRAGILAATEIRGRSDLNLHIVGFVDDDRAKVGSTIGGVKVLGVTEDLPHLVSENNVDHVIVSIAHAPRREFRRILELCESIPVKVRVIPALSELIQGNVKVSRIRDVEVHDLLGREQVHLDEETMTELLTGKVVMITGAGGSIGSELVRQVSRYSPEQILLVERAEFALFEIEREMRAACPGQGLVPLIADVSDPGRMRSIFANYRPHVVLHAAAHKHVPMMESNACEAVKNNVLGTNLTGELAGEFGVETFVLISTDKAVRPTSVMGATKRTAELVVQNLNARFDTKYMAVRFGNVIGSAGSVIPIFREQIQRGGPVTVTHPDMVRYFMTIPEAAQLVLQAGAIGAGGEIFVLDMGEPVKILDLALETIRLSGLRPYEDIDIIFSGVRPGEKLYEELQATGEELTLTQHPKIFIGKITAVAPEKVGHALTRLEHIAKGGWDDELRRELNELLHEAKLQYHPPALTPINSSSVFESVSASA